MQLGGMGPVVISLMVVLVGTMAIRPHTPRLDRLVVRMYQLVDIVDQLKIYVSDLDSEFLPSPQDVKRHCEQSAFSCFQTQLKAADTGENGKKIKGFIKQLKRKLPPTKAGQREEHKRTCPSCDSYEKKPLKEFLERLKSLLQKMIHQRLSYKHGA